MIFFDRRYSYEYSLIQQGLVHTETRPWLLTAFLAVFAFMSRNVKNQNHITLNHVPVH